MKFILELIFKIFIRDLLLQVSSPIGYSLKNSHGIIGFCITKIVIDVSKARVKGELKLILFHFYSSNIDLIHCFVNDLIC